MGGGAGRPFSMVTPPVSRTRRLRLATARTTEQPVDDIGVSTPEQAAEIAGFADGVIVGSALVEALLEAPDQDAGLAALRALTAELARGVRGEG